MASGSQIKTIMKNTLLTIAAALCLSACSNESSPDSLKATKQSFSSPQKIGTLPDGREVKLVIREMGDNLHDHYIYFVDSSVTINTTVKIYSFLPEAEK